VVFFVLILGLVLFDCYMGCLIGGVIGDALGCFVEIWLLD